MNEQVNIELLPSNLLKHEDRVVMLTNKWMILAGIDRHGELLPEMGLLSVYYCDYGYWVRLTVSEEIFEERQFFWVFTRKRVASKLRQLRNGVKND